MARGLKPTAIIRDRYAVENRPIRLISRSRNRWLRLLGVSGKYRFHIGYGLKPYSPSSTSGRRMMKLASTPRVLCTLMVPP
jgi:hypothetical protein